MTILSNRRGFPARAALLLALAVGIGLSSGAETLAQSRQAPLPGPSLALPRLSSTVSPQRTAGRATPQRPFPQQPGSGIPSRRVEGEALATLVINKSRQQPGSGTRLRPPAGRLPAVEVPSVRGEAREPCGR